MLPIEAGLNRSLTNVLVTGFGSSELQIRYEGGKWIDFMEPDRTARGSYCTECGCLLIAPSIQKHRDALDLDN